FFQAEDGIRDRTVTGVQTCALPISILYYDYDNLNQIIDVRQYDGDGVTISDANGDGVPDKPAGNLLRAYQISDFDEQGRVYRTRSEERRVGKEVRCRGA